MNSSVIDVDSQPTNHIEVFDTFAQPKPLSEKPKLEATLFAQASTEAVVNLDDQAAPNPEESQAPPSKPPTIPQSEEHLSGPNGTKKCPQCFATFKPGSDHNCFQLLFSLISKKVDKDSFKCLQSKINQKFVQLAIGKKITLLNDEEVPDNNNPHNGNEVMNADGTVGRGKTKKNPGWAQKRIDMKKTLIELSSKMQGCVSQGQFSENISKISDVFEKYSSKISEIDTFIGKIRNLSQPTIGNHLDTQYTTQQTQKNTQYAAQQSQRTTQQQRQKRSQITQNQIPERKSIRQSSVLTPSQNIDLDMTPTNSLERYEFDIQNRELSEVLTEHQSLHPSSTPNSGQLDVFDLCGYQTKHKFEYPPRQELLSTAAGYYSNRKLTKIEWSINDQQVIDCLRVTFSDGRQEFSTPIFTHKSSEISSEVKPRIQSCVSIPYDEAIRTVQVIADKQQVYQVAMRSEYLEYPAFILDKKAAIEDKLTTEFELCKGQSIIGVYGCTDVRNKRHLNGAEEGDTQAMNYLPDFNQEENVPMLAGIGFIVWSPAGRKNQQHITI